MNYNKRHPKEIFIPPTEVSKTLFSAILNEVFSELKPLPVVLPKFYEKEDYQFLLKRYKEIYGVNYIDRQNMRG